VRDARRKPSASLRAAAVRMLARREYPRAELRDRLARAGGDRDEIERVLDALERDGYLSDARYAQMIVAQKAGRFGPRAIAYALRERGVAAQASSDALEALRTVDEVADARRLLSRRFADPPADDRERARQVRFLVGRGYGLSIALAVVRGVSGSPRRPREEPNGES
jgi:regulatory protein